MASRLRDLTGKPSSGASSGRPKAKVAQNTWSTNVVESSLPPPPLRPTLAGQLMIIATKEDSTSNQIFKQGCPKVWLWGMLSH
uniref:Uncharacterized protein n=1 Tax=Cannabis sativa TaxID=3483 RepID=A0A803Q1W2_CANSA